MKKILLVCAAGMSTSMLVKRMIDHANAISLEVNISALAIAEAKGKIKNNEVDVVLLGPQVRFQKPEIEAVAQGKMPVAVIEMKDYGSMNGQAVLEIPPRQFEKLFFLRLIWRISPGSLNTALPGARHIRLPGLLLMMHSPTAAVQV